MPLTVGAGFIEDENGRKVIMTTKRDIAENCFTLKGKPFSLADYPPMATIYESNAKFTVIQSGRQVSKCAVGSAMVSQLNGSLRRMDEMRVGEEVLSMDDRYRLVAGKVIDTIDTDPRDCVRITTRMGHVLDVARTHPLRRIADYIPAGKIAIGERVAAMRAGGAFTGTSKLSSDEIKILAYMIADGSMQGRQNFGFINKNTLLLDDYRASIDAVGQKAPRSYDRKGSTSLSLSCAKDAPVRILIEAHGLYGSMSGNKFVPDDVFDLDREMTALFINRIWACDGMVRRTTPSKYDLTYCSISERLARGVQALLWKFEIPTSLSTFKPEIYEGTDKLAYVVRIETQEGIRLFLTQIGALGKSEGVLLPAAESNNNRDTIPQEVQLILDRIFRKSDTLELTRGRGQNSMAAPSCTSYNLRRTLKYPPTHKKIMAYMEFFEAIGLQDDADVQLLHDLSDSHVIWDEIVSIEDLGKQPCFDIEIDTYHNYVMNGVVVHNSTTAANFMVAENIGMPHWESIAVLPSIMQMRRFSNLRVGKLIGESKVIRDWFMNTACRRNVTERSFTNGSAMYFGALSQVESLRGLSANRILEDEVQDMVSDDLPIVEESLSGQSSDRQFIMRTGTAKTVGNLLEETFRQSTACEWIVVCPSGHHNIPDAENIEQKGFTCKKCKAICSTRNGYWRAMNPFDRKWLGFRIPQIILPMHTEDPAKWAEIFHKRHHLSPITFLNEVMGHSAGSGIDFLSEDDLRACCQPEYSAYEMSVPREDRYLVRFATIDWGLTARRSFTIVGIWGVTPEGRMKLLHAHRFIQNDPFAQVERIAQLVVSFNVNVVGADWGAGFMQSLQLERLINRPVHRFMYVGEQAELIKWDKDATLWKVNRTQAMTETFMRMRERNYWFPKWSECEHLMKDILCIFCEAVEDKITKNDKFRYDHPADSPDDFSHVCTYAGLLFYLMTNHKL